MTRSFSTILGLIYRCYCNVNQVSLYLESLLLKVTITFSATTRRKTQSQQVIAKKNKGEGGKKGKGKGRGKQAEVKEEADDQGRDSMH